MGWSNSPFAPLYSALNNMGSIGVQVTKYRSTNKSL